MLPERDWLVVGWTLTPTRCRDGSARGPVGGGGVPVTEAPSTGPGLMAASIGARVVMATMTVSVALRRNNRIKRCTIECCLSLNVAGSIAASRRTMASAVICRSVASQLSIVTRYGSSLEGMRIRFL